VAERTAGVWVLAPASHAPRGKQTWRTAVVAAWIENRKGVNPEPGHNPRPRFWPGSRGGQAHAQSLRVKPTSAAQNNQPTDSTDTTSRESAVRPPTMADPPPPERTWTQPHPNTGGCAGPRFWPEKVGAGSPTRLGG